MIYFLGVYRIVWKNQYLKHWYILIFANEEFALVFNEKQNYLQLKEDARTKVDQLDYIERDKTMEHGKSIRFEKILKHNEKQNLKFITNG